jgi:hypothetical protein
MFRYCAILSWHSIIEFIWVEVIKDMLALILLMEKLKGNLKVKGVFVDLILNNKLPFQKLLGLLNN